MNLPIMYSTQYFLTLNCMFVQLLVAIKSYIYFFILIQSAGSFNLLHITPQQKCCHSQSCVNHMLSIIHMSLSLSGLYIYVGKLSMNLLQYQTIDLSMAEPGISGRGD